MRVQKGEVQGSVTLRRGMYELIHEYRRNKLTQIFDESFLLDF